MTETAQIGVGWVHVHAPRPDSVVLRRVHCPTCERRRFFVVSHTPWYGINETCLWCGERFDDEGRAERPFERGWRKRSIESARRHYRRYRTLPETHSSTPGGA